jgi:hypothetical protein
VFTRNAGVWTQQGAKLTGSGETAPAFFGGRVALSADGNTALIGGYYDDVGVGAAWVFTRSAGVWTQQGAKLTGSGQIDAGRFGWSLALSADGNTGLIGGFADNGYAGAAWVFTRNAGVWTQQGAKLTGSGEIYAGVFGWSVALSADGNTALIGGPSDNVVGAAWVFVGFSQPCISGTRNGPLIVAADQSICFAPGSRNIGSITVKAGGALDLEGATISGSLRATGAAAVRLCGSSLSNVSISGTTGLVLIGGDAATGPCAGNLISGAVSLTGNGGGVEFNSNTVTGSLVITGNTGSLPPPDAGPVHVTGNTITGPRNIQQ